MKKIRENNIIIGPCSIENKIQFEQSIIEIIKQGYSHIRGGIYKPRTDPNKFNGLGIEGIDIVRELQKRHNFTFYTEISNLTQLEQIRGIKANIWIGARSSGDPFTMAQLSEAINPREFNFIGIKNPIANDSKLWMGAVSRFLNKGIKVNPIFRGFINPHSLYRNEPNWSELEEFRINLEFNKSDIYIDPSHIAGHRELLKQIIDYSQYLGYENFIIEAHPCPENALTDADQQISIKDLHKYYMPGNAPIDYLRYEFDNIDNQIISLLDKRKALSKEMGIVKKAYDLSITDPIRKSQVMSKWGAYKNVYEEIHSQSVFTQIKN